MKIERTINERLAALSLPELHSAQGAFSEKARGRRQVSSTTLMTSQSVSPFLASRKQATAEIHTSTSSVSFP